MLVNPIISYKYNFNLINNPKIHDFIIINQVSNKIFWNKNRSLQWVYNIAVLNASVSLKDEIHYHRHPH